SSHELLGSDYDDIERLAPPPVSDSVEWSVSYSLDCLNRRKTNIDVDDEESSAGSGDDCVQNIAASLGNLFFDPKCRSTSCSDASDLDSIVFAEKDEVQMEFCEKSTLRQAIDDGELFTDVQKTWRLFREICEGLTYIHRKGCIHRDLKPVNIFLDSNDHAKIGDFGLATHGLTYYNQATNADFAPIAMSADFLNDSNEAAKIEFTTMIGTALYISPELSTGGKKLYTQHVDIYSLGVILFEMFYRPLGTGMERVKILSELRLPEIRIPDDFGRQCPSTKNLVKLLQWMLQHEAEKRPLADELLHSELLPPVEMQKNDFELAINNTLSRTQTRQYRWLINAIMEQKPSTVQDYVYDDDIYPKIFSVKSTLNTRLVANKLKRLFSTHGIVEVDTPLLLPKNKVLAENLESRVDLMDESGLVLHLPYDLRIPFGRYVIRCDIAHLKRYCIGTVYRHPGRLESHPRQITECALDFVTSPNCCPASTAEILSILSDIVYEFPALQEKNYSIRINHTSITKAIIMHFGVHEKEKCRKIMHIVSDFASNKLSKQRRDQKLQSEMKLSDKSMSGFLDLLDTEDHLCKLSSKLRIISKKNQAEACSLCRDALHELEVVVNLCESLEVRLPIVVCPRLLFALHEYKGIVYQVSYDQKLKRPGRTQFKANILAAGGRYDRLLKKFRKSIPGKPSSLQSMVSAVGVSIAFDTIVNMIGSFRYCQYDVLICSVGRKLLLKEKLSLAKSLWAMNVKTDFIQEPVANLEDLQEYCRKNGVEYLIIFKDGELNAVRVKNFGEEKMIEKKLNALDVPSYLQDKLACLTLRNDISEGSYLPQARMHLDSTGSISVQCASVANLSNVNVHFATTEKLTIPSKKRYEFQMSAAIGSVIRRFSSRETLDVILTNLPASVLQYFIGTIDLSSEINYQKSTKEITVKFNKQKQSILLLIDEIWKWKLENGIILLYSYLDDFYKVLL
uniref:non-specific serine/threonine protein kinase n=1 Tax=Romanomermis culicivorax TaxID=13658 RepID=A0A915KKB7_ROMCU